MIIKTRKLRGFQLFDISGDLTENTAKELKRTIEDSVVGKRPQALLNLNKVTEINSYGIGVLVWLWKWLAEKQGTMCLIGKPNLSEKFQRMNLSKIIKVFHTEADFINNAVLLRKQDVKTTTADKGKYKVVRIEEELEVLVDAQGLLKQLKGLVDEGHAFIQVDLSKISYLYSDLMGVFVAVANQLKKVGGGLSLTGLNDDLMYYVENTGLDKVLTVPKKVSNA